MQSVIVFGGSGFIGTHLVQRFEGQHDVHVVSVDLKLPRKKISGVEYRIGDVRSLESFEVPDKIETIYNLSAIHITPGHEPWEYYDTNVRGAIEVTRLATRSRVKEIVFTSSISVYGSGEDTKSEMTAVDPTSDYGRSKIMAEEIHKSWANLDHDRRLVVVRPAVVFGAGEGGNFTRMAKLLRRGFFVFPGRRDTIKACIYVEDLLDAVMFARSQPERQVIFNGSFSQRYTIGQIVENFRSAYFPKAVTVDLPESVVRLGAGLLRNVGGARLGLHPDRVTKLVRSTDVVPNWLIAHGWKFDAGLPGALARWNVESEGRFD